MKESSILLTVLVLLIGIVFVIGSCKKDEGESNQNPNCKITSITEGQKIKQGEIVAISVEATDSDGTIKEVQFSIDGIGRGNATSFPYNYSWNTSNESVSEHTLKAKSIDNNGGSKTDEVKVEIIDGGDSPIAEFIANPTNGASPLTVSFTDQSQNNPTTWSWEFGNGGTSTQQNPTYAFESTGSFTVKLTVSNSQGSDSEIKTGYITVSETGEAPIAEFSADNTNGYTPLFVQFSDQSQNNPTTWSWEFGDGATSAQQSPTHTYESTGNFTVKLTVSNNQGSDSEIKTGYINVSEPGESPIAEFSADNTNGYKPLFVQFTDLSQNNPTTWLWEFGEGATSTQQSPTHTYISEGDYTVTLSVSNDFGNDFKTKNNLITTGSTGGTLPTGYFTDVRDNQEYAYIEIGSQTWMAENLNYETGNSSCYANDDYYCNVYGRLYDWQTALNACPQGWHLPSDEEWKMLEMTLGMSQYEADNTGWRGTNQGTSLKSMSNCWFNEGHGYNYSGFDALPGGLGFSLFGDLRAHGLWWTSTINWDIYRWGRALSYDEYGVYRTYYAKSNGFSVRCVKD